MTEKIDYAGRRRAQEESNRTLSATIRALDENILREKQSAVALEGRIAALAQLAASGDRDALKKQRALIEEKSTHELQAKNLAYLAEPLRAELVKAQSSLTRYILAEQISFCIATNAEFPAIAKHMADTVAAVAQECGQLKVRMLASFAKALPLLGDRERFAKLNTELAQSVDLAVRVGVFNIFREHGIAMPESGKLAGVDFETLLCRPLDTFRRALESALHTASRAVPGFAFFTAKMNVGGFCGSDIKAGDVIAAHGSDPDVLRLVAAGAIERIPENAEAV